MFKKILLILSALWLCSCQTSNNLTKSSTALYNIEDITFKVVDNNVTIDNHNNKYSIGFTYELSSLENIVKDTLILRPGESYTLTLDFNPNSYSTNDLTYYDFDYSIDYELVYEDGYVLIFLDEDDYSLVKQILNDEIRLSKIVNRYNQTYKFSFGYYAYYNEETNSYDIYYKDTYLKTLIL